MGRVEKLEQLDREWWIQLGFMTAGLAVGLVEYVSVPELSLDRLVAVTTAPMNSIADWFIVALWVVPPIVTAVARWRRRRRGLPEPGDDQLRGMAGPESAVVLDIRFRRFKAYLLAEYWYYSAVILLWLGIHTGLLSLEGPQIHWLTIAAEIILALGLVFIVWRVVMILKIKRIPLTED